MKKLVLIAGVILFFLILLGLVVLKLFLPTTKTTTQTAVQFPAATSATGSTDQDPQQFVQSFYSWYLQNFVRDPYFPHPENRDTVLSPWLTNDFLANWDQTVLDLEVNPVLLTAEDPTPWGNSITASVAEQSIRTETIRVTIGTGENLHAYNVQVVRQQDGTWRINMVSSTI